MSFSSPGPGTQAFYDLYVSKTGGSVTLGSDMVVANIFYAYDATLAQGLRALPTLEVYGGLSVYQTTFDGLPVRLVSSLTPNSHVMSGVTFTNMPTNVPQLYLEMGGGGSTSPFVLQSPSFATPPLQGGYYIQAVNTSQAGALLEVRVYTPTPATVDPAHLIEVGVTDIVWPYQ